MKKFLLAITLVTGPLVFLSGQSGFSFITDQDFFLITEGKNEDRNYTQGTAFALSDERFYSSAFFAPFRLYNNILSDSLRERTPVMSTVSITGTAFTPRIIDSANPILGDRPFAFLLALHFSQVSRIERDNGNRNHYEAVSITCGLLGTHLGYDFQSFAHKYIVKGRPIDPKGWNTQISNGGIPTFLFNYDRLRIFNLNKKQKAWGLDGFINFGGSAGYYDRVYTGLYLRAGWIEHSELESWAFWGGSLSASDKAQIAVTRSRNFMEMFIFSKATVNIMARNSMLVGQIWSNRPNEYTLDYSWIKVGVLDVDIGLALGFHWYKKKRGDEFESEKYLKFLYKNTIRSPEFDSGIFPKRWHYFGSVGFQFSIG